VGLSAHGQAILSMLHELKPKFVYLYYDAELNGGDVTPLSRHKTPG
jgi:hypothetical protein